MNRFTLEAIKFIYAIVLAFFGLVAFSLFFDLLCFVLFGWDASLGPFPIVNGTIRSYWYSGLFYSTCLILFSGGITRVIMGDHVPFFLPAQELPKEPQDTDAS